jgi:hypothetical protein
MGTQYLCKSKERREAVRNTLNDEGQPILNGMDFLEVDPATQQTLTLRFIHNLPGASSNPVPPAPVLTAANIRITGGVRVKQIDVLNVVLVGDDTLDISVSAPGDFSNYTLSLITSQEDPTPPLGFDPQLSEIDFSFKVACPNDFDCKPFDACLPDWSAGPEINYLAKDYASFRRLMLDRMAILLPEWKERHAADAGIALVELLAYVADYLSYQQDAVATEAYLGTARRRTSVRRHARLVDYFLHDGCNARVWVQVRVKPDPFAESAEPVTLTQKITVNTKPFTTKILTRLSGQEMLIAPASTAYREALKKHAEVFELMHDATLYEAHNELYFYTWGASECCLPKGATRATLKKHLPNLQKGQVLIFKEVRGPQTGEPEDADPKIRHAVRLTKVVSMGKGGGQLVDPLNGEPVTEIEWHTEDALPFPFCISSRLGKEHNEQEIADVSVALGNIILADHGRTIDEEEELGTVPRSTISRIPAAQATTAVNPLLLGVNTGKASSFDMGDDAEGDSRVAVPPRFRPRLKDGPLTFAAPYPYVNNEEPLQSASAAMQRTISDALPQVVRLRSVLKTSTQTLNEEWTTPPKRDLLNSSAEKTEFVVEVESDGVAHLRFGDDRYGARPPSDAKFLALYRIGNGVHGNVGHGSLAHIVTNQSGIISVSNELPAMGGTAPESIEQVRQSAPSAFRTQERAVTNDDYRTMTERHTSVQRAAASMRWTGSWHTVFLTIDRYDGRSVTQEFEAELRRHLERYRMAGHDLEIDNPRFVALEIEMHVCVKPDYFRSDVKAALLLVFSNRLLPDGRRGVFHPDNFTFGQPVYLSTLYAAATSVEGVASVEVRKFQRQGNSTTNALKAGELKLDRVEIARLDNDPNFPDRGIFRLIVEGGK